MAPAVRRAAPSQSAYRGRRRRKGRLSYRHGPGAAGIHDVRDVTVTFVLGGPESGCLRRPITLVGSSRSRRKAPIEYCLTGPTPWLRPASPLLSQWAIPQFPIWISSHGNAGSRMTMGHTRSAHFGIHQVQVLIVLPESIAYRPLIFLGKSAMPLFCAAGPLSVIT